VRDILKGATDQSVVIRIVDSADGTPETGVTSGTGGLDLKYRREGATVASLTESDLSALSDAHSDGGMLHIGAGYYRIDVPDAAFATGSNGVLVFGTVTGMVVIGCYVPLVDYNPQDAVRLGLSGLANATPGAAGGLLIAGTNAPVTITGAGTALSLVSASGNGHGLRVEGNGTGEGLSAQGGASGHGIHATGGATTGNGIRAEGQASDSEGITGIGGGTDGEGIVGTGVGNGAGVAAYGGATGPGVVARGGATSGPGARFEAQTNDDGVNAVGAGTGVDIRGDLTGNITGNLSGSAGSVTAGVTLANDAITAAKFDESTAFPLKSDDSGSTAVARVNRLSTLVTKVATVQTDGGNSATQILTDLTETEVDHWRYALVKITSGALAEQVRKCTGYDGAGTLTFTDGFTDTPADAVTLELVND
jgi:hypothetical protein